MSLPSFDGLVIATRTTPRGLPRPEFDDVHLLRTVDDALALRAESARGPRVVVIGGGFIGCEVAATAHKLGVGVVPATGWLRGSELQVDDGVLCDARRRAVNSSSVGAAGDVARWPYFWSGQYDTRLQFVGRSAGADGGRLAHVGGPNVPSS